MQQDLGWSRTFLSGAFSFALLVGAGTSVAVGRWLDRRAARPLFLAGALAGTAGVAGWAAARTQWEFVAVWAVLGACQAILFYTAAFTVLTKRFEGTERHNALTTVTLVAGLASTIFAPLTAVLEQSLGWRGAVVVLAGILGCATLPAFLLALGKGGPVRPPPSPTPPAAPKMVFRGRPFWTLTAAYLLSTGISIAVAVHLVAFLRSNGLGAESAAAALGGIGLVQVLGRVGYLRAGRRLRPMQLGTLALAGKAIGLALLLALPGLWGVGLFVLLYGSANGATSLTQATSVAELYGPVHFGAIAGLMGAVTAAGAALAPLLAAGAIDAVGRQAPVFAAMAVLSGLAALLNQSAPSASRRSRDEQSDQ